MADTNRELLVDPKLGASIASGALPVTRLSSMLSEAPRLAGELLPGGGDDQSDLLTLVESVSAIASYALLSHDAQLFAEAVATFAEIWRLGNRDAMLPLVTPDPEASLWENLAIHLYALGGLAVRVERWEDVPVLALQDPSSRGVWLRQGQVASARRGELEAYGESLLELAARRLRRFDSDAPEDEALAAVCRFDLLAALLIAQTDPGGFYPNAAKYGEQLVEAIVIEKVRDRHSDLRQHIFRDDDVGLRPILGAYDEKARLQGAFNRYAGGDWRWRGFEDARTLAFIVTGDQHD